MIDLYRVIDHELDWLQRVDLGRISSKADDAVAHCSEIDNGVQTGEGLEELPCGREGNLFVEPRRHFPLPESAHVVADDESSVFTAQQVLEQDLQRVRQSRDVRKSAPFERWQTVNG